MYYIIWTSFFALVHLSLNFFFFFEKLYIDDFDARSYKSLEVQHV